MDLDAERQPILAHSTGGSAAGGGRQASSYAPLPFWRSPVFRSSMFNLFLICAWCVDGWCEEADVPL